MSKLWKTVIAASVLLCGVDGTGPADGGAQEAERGQLQVAMDMVLTADAKTTIREFYSGRPPAKGNTKVKSLPPGIRKNLERGKPLPPGIAKRAAPADLHSRIQIPAGYELFEVGLDVVLVNAATQVIQDVLLDVIR